MIQQLHGVQKIFELFKKNVSKYSKDRAALSIGYIYRSREITDPNMRFEIINYLVSVLGDSDMKVKVKPVFKCLADNIMNCAEILNEQVLMKIEQDLKQPLEGNEEQIKSIIQKQENWCFLLKTILEGRNDDVLRKNIIKIGIAQQLLHIFESCELKIISQEYSNLFYLLMNPAGSEIKQLLFAMKPFQGILQLLDHANIDILDDAIDSLFNFLIEGANKSVISKVHPYFDMVQQFNGIEKIFNLFQRNANKNTRDTSAICLGFLFRSREITNVEIKVQIITFLKNHINDKDDWNKNQSRRSLKGLSYNAVNRAEILNDEELKKIEHDLKLPLEESKENRKSTILIQEYWFLLLLIVLDGRADDELRRQIIQARILDRFLRIFEQREYSLITNIITQAFISLIKPSSKDIGLLIFIKKPFTGLLRLLIHPNSQIVDDAISSIFHIIISGCNTSTIPCKHPHYDAIQELNGVDMIYELFQQNISKYSLDRAALTIGYLFRFREIPDQNMRFEIIDHLTSLLSDETYRDKAKTAINYLIENAENREEITNQNNLKIMELDLKQTLEGDEDEQMLILQKQENWSLLLSVLLDEKTDEDLRKQIIEIGIVDQLIHIFETRDLALISRAMSYAFNILTIPASNEIRIQLYDKKPYPGLLRLLNHPNSLVINDAIVSIFHILLAGASITEITTAHPHFDTLIQCNGVEKIFELFKKNLNKGSKDRAAVCIGHIFRAREIPNFIMRREIINYLKTLLKSQDEQIKISAQFRLQGLALNSVNCIEIGDISFMITKGKDNIHGLIEEDEWNELEEEPNYEDEYYNGDEDKDYYGYDDEEEEEEEEEEGDDDGIGAELRDD
ncbi:MAG: hypothetical protein EZS28_010437 [Streblomastix strix]|uniref:Uncharacterized protein n=1 Tax=Streblomastix strix TaxID=222440 RepID=A0A5J4WH84_9EUKA|nr:MAG: hypothetical protein EZS28_010437 [Streblomastix strix]